MKHSLLLLACLLSVLPLTQAIAGSSQQMGRTSCGAAFDCSAMGFSSGDFSPEKIVKLADLCVRNSFGNISKDPMFSTSSYGLSAGDCLTTLASQPAVNGGTLTPHCCINPTENGLCVLSCSLELTN